MMIIASWGHVVRTIAITTVIACGSTGQLRWIAAQLAKGIPVNCSIHAITRTPTDGAGSCQWFGSYSNVQMGEQILEVVCQCLRHPRGKRS